MLTHPLFLAFAGLTAVLFIIGSVGDWAEKRWGDRLPKMPEWARTILAALVALWLLGAAIILLVIFLCISGGGPYGSGAIYGD